MSERAVIDQNFKKNKKLNNYVTSILKSNDILSEVKKFGSSRNDKTLEEVTLRIIEIVKHLAENLLDVRPIPAEMIKSSVADYDIKDYVADIVQFLSGKNVLNVLQRESRSI